MDRSFSVDDLVGGIWRLGQAGVGRSDSEAAFQELLKGFPSTNNLAAQASGGVDCGQDGAVEEGQNGEREAGEKAASISGFGAAGLPGGMSTGFPTTSIPQVDLSSLPHVLQANGLQAALSAVPGLQGAAHPLVAAAAGLSPAAAAAAAALQLSQLSNAAVVAQAPPAGMDRESLEKAEQRRARRMLSNRESARRSRRRKQDHLMTMEDQINILLEDKRKWMETKESLERRCELAEEESRKLREENQRLRDELRILDLVKGDLLSGSLGKGARAADSAHEDPAEKPALKRKRVEENVQEGQNTEQSDCPLDQPEQGAAAQEEPKIENDFGDAKGN